MGVSIKQDREGHLCTASPHRRAASEETGRAGEAHRETGGERQSERVRLVQLLACLALFLTVFIGKGVFPQRLDQLGEDILALIGSNTDFRAAFSDLGESLAEQDSVLGDIGEFCIQVFGSGQDSGGEASPALAGGVEEESRFLNSRPDMAELTAHYLRLDRVPDAGCRGSRRRERQPSRHRRPRRQRLRWNGAAESQL